MDGCQNDGLFLGILKAGFRVYGSFGSFVLAIVLFGRLSGFDFSGRFASPWHVAENCSGLLTTGVR